MSYRGRFAPSPTGPLHFGSLISACASYLQARSSGGEWLLRIEDIDPPREIPGATENIIQTLTAFGFEWDGPVLYQSQRLEAYRAAVESLLEQGLAYYCHCSRKQIRATGQPGPEGAIYPGNCRDKEQTGDLNTSVRIRTGDRSIIFEDLIQGRVTQSLETFCGDFVIHRTNNLPAYQMAVVLDDEYQGITEIVRGSDLLSSTPRQMHLQNHLGLATPRYAHHPIATTAEGQKLSKQSFAAAVQPETASMAIWQALHFLGQDPPLRLRESELTHLWAWALENWNMVRIPATKEIVEPQTSA